MTSSAAGKRRWRTLLTEVDLWFEASIFRTLREDADAARAIARMFVAVEESFQIRPRACLATPLDQSREMLAGQIRGYFARWKDALAGVLVRAGHDRKNAGTLSSQTVATIQAGLVLARAMTDPALFRRRLARLKTRLVIDNQDPNTGSLPPLRGKDAQA